MPAHFRRSARLSLPLMPQREGHLDWQPRRRRWAAAAAVAAAGLFLLIAASPATAEMGDRFERIERWHGFGWGDGYHSCYDPGPRPWADLPPRPYTARQPCQRCQSRPPEPAPTTFYDRFDAGLIPSNGPAPQEPSALETTPATGVSEPNRATEAEPVETPDADAAPPSSADRAADSLPRPRIVGLHCTGPRR